MYNGLIIKLVIMRIIRNIFIAAIAAAMSIVIFKYIRPIVDDIDFSNKEYERYAQYIALSPIAVLAYLVAFGFNRLINRFIMVKLFTNIDKRLKPISFSNLYKLKEFFKHDKDIHHKVINGAAIVPYQVDLYQVIRTIVLDFDCSAKIFMTDFSSSDLEKLVNAKTTFNGAVIAFKNNSPVIESAGTAVFINKDLYEECKEREAYEIYSQSPAGHVNNSKILEYFHIYFSNAEIAGKFNNSDILDAILKIKDSFGSARVNVSFQKDVFYIMVENEDIKLRTSKAGFYIFISRVKAAINMYEVLKSNKIIF